MLEGRQEEGKEGGQDRSWEGRGGGRPGRGGEAPVTVYKDLAEAFHLEGYQCQ